MAKSSGGKLAIFLIVAIVGAAAGYGYFKQAAKLKDDPTGAATDPKIEQAILTPKPTDIIVGDTNAIVTMVEYSSLSCPHCAHFHQEILPTLRKEFIDTGKVKLIVRYFPLNEPAVKASQVVECAGRNGLDREAFLSTLYSMQKQWAMDENFLKSLKQIASVGGLDSAAFDSCIADNDMETRILATRQEATDKLSVTSTPTFFINGIRYEADPSVEGFRGQFEAIGGGK